MALPGTKEYEQEQVLRNLLRKWSEELEIPYTDDVDREWEYLKCIVEHPNLINWPPRISVGYTSSIMSSTLLEPRLQARKLVRRSFKAIGQSFSEKEVQKIKEHMKKLHEGCVQLIKEVKAEQEEIEEILGFPPGNEKMMGLFPGTIRKVSPRKYKVEMEVLLNREQLWEIGRVVGGIPWWDRER